MNVLVIGGGGREHALCWKIKQSPVCGALYCLPGSDAIAELAVCLPFAGAMETVSLCHEKEIDLVVIGPEQPLADGLSDVLQKAGIAVCAPSQAAAQIETSKAFMKELCAHEDIPTAAYGVFKDPLEAKKYVQTQSFPVVVKASGLAAGKGVVIAQNTDEAEAAIDALSQTYGATLVVEEFLQGEEVSLFFLCDGTGAFMPLGSAQDHKRAFNGDTGPNTGGMGAYSPAPQLDEMTYFEILSTIISPALDGLRRHGAPFKGVLFAGLMLTDAGPKLLEFNARFGDPETQAILPRLENDLLPYLKAAATGKLGDMPPLEWKQECALGVVLASEGYPGDYEKDLPVPGLSQLTKHGVQVFHAGSKKTPENFVTNGGRVAVVVGLGADVTAAHDQVYTAIETVKPANLFWRTDIGYRALEGKKRKGAA